MSISRSIFKRVCDIIHKSPVFEQGLIKVGFPDVLVEVYDL